MEPLHSFIFHKVLHFEIVYDREFSRAWVTRQTTLSSAYLINMEDELVFAIFSPTTTSSSIQASLLLSIVSDVIVNVTCWIIFHDVFCVGNGGDKPTSVLRCRYQLARASVTCNMFIYFSFLSIVFSYADRKKDVQNSFVLEQCSSRSYFTHSPRTEQKL